jgi:hypothetical protein
MPTPPELVDNATLVLHVKARVYCPRQECSELPASIGPEPKPIFANEPMSSSSIGAFVEGLIAFDVIEVLKGPNMQVVVAIPGKLVERDDYNDQRVPYNFVRREGRSGSCYARTYRQGAEYLLFLRPVGKVMTPYWAPLAPINEQVRSAQDPWVVWVRNQLRAK